MAPFAELDTAQKRDKVTGEHARPQGPVTPASRLGPDTGLCFLLFYLYVWLVIDPRLILHNLGIRVPYHPFSFSSGWPFFREHLVRSGGLAEYGERFLSQFHCFGWAGSLIITIAALLACLCTDVFARCAGGSRGMVLRYVPGVVLLAMYGQYFHPLRSVLSLLVVLAGFVLYLRLAPRNAALRFAVFLLTWGVLYHVAGVAGLLFPVLAAVFEILVNRRLVLGAAALLVALGATCATGEMLFGLEFDKTYGPFLVSDPGIPEGGRPYVVLLFLFFPVALALAAFKRAALTRSAMRWIDRLITRTERPRIRVMFRYLGQGERKRILAAAVVLFVAGVVALLSLDTPLRTVLLTDYYAQHNMWPEVLDTAEELPRGIYHAQCNRNVMLALFHTGRMADEMFRYPQTPGLEFFSIRETRKDTHAYFQESRAFLALGQVNRAERFAFETLEGAGDLPAVLKHLAVINVVKDRPQTATLFLNALAKSPLHRRTAAELLQRLRSNPRLETDPEIRQIRRVMTGKDSVSSAVGAEELLQALLEENPDNKMAFEFLMAHYLCIGRPDMVVANLDRLKDFGYGAIPRHYQEAIIVHTSATEEHLPTAEFPLDPEIIESAKRFSDILAAAPSPGAAMHTAVEAGFGDSYFFYITCGVSGL